MAGILTKPEYRPDTDVLVRTEEDLEKNKAVKVNNDDFNTFEHVIMCLISYCGHSTQKAQQLTLKIHEEGGAIVKSGQLIEMVAIKEALCENGLDAELIDIDDE